MLRSAKREAPTFLRKRLEIRLDENLHGLFAGINLDTNGRVAEMDLVSSFVRSSNDGVGHYRLAFRGRRRYQTTFDRSRPQKAEPLWSGTVRAVGST
jgi:hypothetical protein